MFKKWNLKGFKSIYDETEFNISPLTIFTGANSSGKSSVIQSILLSTQTLQNNVDSKPLILNGPIIQLGNFFDILSYKHEQNDIKIGFELESTTNFKNKFHILSLEEEHDYKEKNIISCSYNFSIQDDNNEISALQPIITESKISVYDEIKKKTLTNVEVFRTNLSIEDKMKFYKIDNINERSYNSLKFDVKSSSLTVESENYGFIYNRYSQLSEEYIGAELLHFIPKNVISRVNKFEVSAIRLLDSLRHRNYPIKPTDIEFILNKNFIDKVVNGISAILEEESSISPIRLEKLKGHLTLFKEEEDIEQLLKLLKTLPSKAMIKWTEFLDLNSKDFLKNLTSKHDPKYALLRSSNLINQDYINEIVKYFNNNVKYLGPLRDEPKPIYPNMGSFDSRDVGYRGEYTAAVLELHKDTIINYLSPTDLESNVYKEKEGRLIEAVLEWLNYMGISKNVKTVDRGKLGHELQVQLSENGKYHDLTNVGVGVSQVLPILVLSLLAEKNSTIIFEQPELHLHPKVQTRLADFFVTMIKLNKQCILETHSEYLINRLRYKAVSSPKDNIQNDVMIYFVEQEDGKSIYRSIQINEFGVIEDWPKGFFDEHEKTSSAILKAARQKNRGI
ncbi:DUF3696 domain-containing protein [Solibacillus sp. FSL W7-1472]|uniref:DUF3696 domain-containing protein n=1 Tax=Solibacillus sp. FSL W7-1472 TaxID=2921707 RepID=UPI0030DA2390